MKKISLGEALKVSLSKGYARATAQYHLGKKVQSDNRKLRKLLREADALLAQYVPGMYPRLEQYCVRYEKVMGKDSAIVGGE